MPCKIEIKENLTNKISADTDSGYNKSLEGAQAIAKEVNKQYGVPVVKFTLDGDFIVRDINIPDSLVDRYYEHELTLEQQKKASGEQLRMFQTGNVPASVASKETVEKVKQVADKMGVKIQELVEYAKSNPDIETKNTSGVADLTKGVIAIATGKEDQAITEELVHIASAMVEQMNPQLITTLISKIDKFKIYKIVLGEYGKLKNYQLPNGKPDIRKIKREAVDKLIAETIVNKDKDANQYPELMEEENISLIKQWWNALLDIIRGKYFSTNIDLFKQLGETIMNADLGSVQDLEQEGLFYQLEANPLVDNIFDVVMDYNNRMNLNPKTPTDKRHYTLDGQRIIGKSVTEKTKENQNMPDRTDAQKFEDDQKKNWGIHVHDFILKYSQKNLIDENGYARKNFGEEYVASELDPEVQKKLIPFTEELIRSYAPGTRFLLEKMVINMNVKDYRPSTIDFIAIEPVKTKDGKDDIKVDVLDWKTMSVNKELTQDVPWQKQKEWKLQMGEYVKILNNYGVKSNQIRKSRMVPFQANYTYIIPGNPKGGLHLSSIEIGTLNNINETNLYLLPVPLNQETTGNKVIDSLVKSLRVEYEKLFKAKISEEGYGLQRDKLDDLSKAIRLLHVKLDFSPIGNVAKNFLKNAKQTIDSLKNIDYNELTADEINAKLGELTSIAASANKYTDIDKTFISEYPREGLNKDDKKILNELESVAASSERLLDEVLKLQQEFARWISVKSGFLTEKTADTILDAEREVDALSRTVLEPSNIDVKIVKLLTKLRLETDKLTKIKLTKVSEEFKSLLLELDKEAKAKGKTPFELIGKIEDGNLHLIKKIDKEFWKELKIANKEKNKQFLIDNMDMAEYNRLKQEMIDKAFKEIDESILSSDPEIDFKQKQYKKTKLLDEIDITRSTFNGYNNSFKFNMLFNKSMKDEDHLSEEYKQLEKNDAAFKMWSFFTRMNRMAKDMGYLDRKDGMAFFPLIEATYLQKFAKSKDYIKESKDFFNDLYRVRAEERYLYGDVDPETKDLKRDIPKPFKFTDKDANQLSTDLGKVGVMYINALLEYENVKNMENVALTLSAVEKSKGRIITNASGDIIFEGEEATIDEGRNNNYIISEKLVDDWIYSVKENQDSFGNVKIGEVTSKLTNDEEKKERYQLSTKKSIEFLNKWTQMLAVGLKPLVALPNYIGANAQAYINSGTFMTFKEFQKNNAKFTSDSLTNRGLTTKEKALINMFVPLNEDMSLEERRKIAKERGFLNWVSTWNFQDVMMVTNSYPDRLIQLASAGAFLENTMVVDGKLVNIRQYLKEQDQKKYKMSFQERRALEKSFDKRVKELKDSKSLEKIIVVDEEGARIPGVTDEEIAKYSVKITAYTRNITGQMSTEDKAEYRRDTLLRGFSMFKNWIVRQASVRFLDVKENTQLDQWEYGRVRAFMKAWIQGCNWNLTRINDIIVGNEKGLAILNTLLEEKREAYYKKTGQKLTISEEEFYDMMRTQIQNEVKELQVLLGLMALMLLTKAAAPDDDDDLAKNRYKWFAKLANKASDELSFYYIPTSFESISKGSLIPAVGILSKVKKVTTQVATEAYGRAVDDQEIIDKTYPLKYFLNVIPVASQWQNDVLPFYDPEGAKERGIRVTTESRQGQ